MAAISVGAPAGLGLLRGAPSARHAPLAALAALARWREHTAWRPPRTPGEARRRQPGAIVGR
ncbi:MAG: hypothetical protein HYZ20_08130 [Burkholderiales bacterium]|nr:hypothetical protein [Burkholderiales bacterium]